MNFIRIIPCGLKHQAVLAALGRDTFHETFSMHHPAEDMQKYIDIAYSGEKIKSNLLQSEVSYFVAYTEDGDAGYIKLISGNRPGAPSQLAIEIEKIYVRKKYQGHHIGSALMEEALKFAKNKQVNHLFLGVWQENKEAISFYKKWGFEIYGTRTFQLGKQLCDDYMMSLAIPDSISH